MKTRIGLLALTLGVTAASAFVMPADAQTVNPQQRQRARWYNAPHEIQIIDDRPVVRDFREAPQAPQGIQLPPGPGSGPGFGGGGAGALGDGGGGGVMPDNQPAGGGNGDPGYRSDRPGGPMGLPKADFGHQGSNIPARGMGPKGPLPGGFTTGVHAKMQAPTAPMYAPPALGTRGAGGPGAPIRAAAAPIPHAASYGGGYGPSVGGGSGGGMSTSADVRGRLLRGVK